jgi:hypothetical protein
MSLEAFLWPTGVGFTELRMRWRIEKAVLGTRTPRFKLCVDVLLYQEVGDQARYSTAFLRQKQSGPDNNHTFHTGRAPNSRRTCLVIIAADTHAVLCLRTDHTTGALCPSLHTVASLLVSNYVWGVASPSAVATDARSPWRARGIISEFVARRRLSRDHSCVCICDAVDCTFKISTGKQVLERPAGIPFTGVGA